MMGRFNALILAIEGVFMLPALIICLVGREYSVAMAFVYSMLITLGISLVLFLLTRKAKKDFFASEGLVCVGLSWIVMSLTGCLPFFLSGQIPSFVDALFETVSGFTTTGASILSEVEHLSKGILYWRSFTNWLGGMGVLVFLLAIVPVGGKNEGFTMHLLRAESPGPSVGKLVPKMRKTASILYLTYIVLTVGDILFLLFGGMSVFDAVCTAMSTAGTGGFGVRNDSIASFSPYIQWVCTVFMLLFGVNFSLYYLILLGQVKAVFKSEELRLYLGIVIGSVAMITLNISHAFQSVGEAIRQAGFQVASILTTTGFSTVDYETWPTFSRSILFVLMLIGGCAGSTSGGLKIMRVLMLIKATGRNIGQILHPNKVRKIRIDGQVVDEKTLVNTSFYFFAYMALIFISFLILSLDTPSLLSDLSAVVACVNNIGPGLEMVGPTGNYGSYSILSKLVLIFDMLAGRLELFPMLVLFSKSAWVRRA
ncbi:MAG: TrkH family potassium uptake protein [Clostridia bacterium]|nr:TrkH family potassium uptake protein [Clostridia bacterium]